MAMSAHFFTSLHPCFKESGTCDGVGKQGLVRHSQSPSDVVQASPFYTVVSAAGSRFCWKECR